MKVLTPTEILFEAMASEEGLRIRVEAPTKFRQQLYAAQRKNPLFSELSFHISPINPNNEIWIVKKDKADGKG